MSEADLIKYGMSPVARVRIEANRFVIDVLDTALVALDRSIYGFVVDNRIMRIGSSKGALRARLRAWERDVTNALNGRRSPTPDWEAQAWREALSQNRGTVFARQATLVRTPVGEFRCYMDEESVLIGRHKPPLNRHTNR
jgi:hypothetical protein